MIKTACLKDIIMQQNLGIQGRCPTKCDVTFIRHGRTLRTINNSNGFVKRKIRNVLTMKKSTAIAIYFAQVSEKKVGRPNLPNKCDALLIFQTGPLATTDHFKALF